MGKLDGKVAVVTGGNSGIGKEAALLYKSEGAKVAIFGRSEITLKETEKELGGDALAVQGDMANLKDLDKLVTEVKSKFGKIDILFANAGIAKSAPFEQSDEALFDEVFNVNVKGLFFLVQKAVPLMEQGSSVILNTSVANRMGMVGMSVYSASKAAVRSLARTLSAELLPKGIRVNAISPGPIQTPIFGRLGMSDDQLKEMSQAIMSQVPMGRMGQARDIANGALFLASSDSSYMAGSELVIDGGMIEI